MRSTQQQVLARSLWTQVVLAIVLVCALASLHGCTATQRGESVLDFRSALTSQLGFDSRAVAECFNARQASLNESATDSTSQASSGGLAAHDRPFLLSSGKSLWPSHMASWWHAPVGPDVVLSVPWRASAALNHDLSDVWARGNLSHVLPAAVTALAGSSHTSVPVMADLYGLLYWRSELAALGLAPPSSYAELLAVCAAFRARGTRCFAVRHLDAFGSLLLVDMVLLRMYGGAFFAEWQNAAVPFTDARVVAALELIAQLVAAGYTLLGSDDQSGWTASCADFAQGRAAMCLSLELTGLRASTFAGATVNVSDLSTLRWPDMRGWALNASGVDTNVSSTAEELGIVFEMVVPLNAQYPAEAREFVAFWTQADAFIAGVANLEHDIPGPMPISVVLDAGVFGSHPYPAAFVARLHSLATLALESTLWSRLEPMRVAFSRTDSLSLVHWLTRALVSVSSPADVPPAMIALDPVLLDYERARLEATLGTTVPPVLVPSSFETSASSLRFVVSTLSRNASLRITAAGVNAESVVTGVLTEPTVFDSSGTHMTVVLVGRGELVVRAVATGPGLRASQSEVARFALGKDVQAGVRAEHTHSVGTLVPWLIAPVAVCLSLGLMLVMLVRRRARQQIHADVQVISPPIVLDANELLVVALVSNGPLSTVFRGTAKDGAAVAIKILCCASGLQLRTGTSLAMLSQRLVGERGHHAGASSGAGAASGATDACSSAPNLPRAESLEHMQVSVGIDSWLASGETVATPRTQLARSLYTSTRASASVGARLAREFAREASALALLRHPNVVQLIGVVAGRLPAIVTEFMGGGSLWDRLGAHQASLEPESVDCSMSVPLFDESFAPLALRCEWAGHVAHGLAYLHGEAIVHGDLKSPNVLLSDNGVAKIADFGRSMRVVPVVPRDVRATNIAASLDARLPLSVLWTAPEILARGVDARSRAGDMYSFGIVLWELFSARRPYAAQLFPLSTVAFHIMNGVRPSLDQLDAELGARARELASEVLAQLWAPEPDARVHFDALARHPISQLWAADCLARQRATLASSMVSRDHRVGSHAHDHASVYKAVLEPLFEPSENDVSHVSDGGSSAASHAGGGTDVGAGASIDVRGDAESGGGRARVDGAVSCPRDNSDVSQGTGASANVPCVDTCSPASLSSSV